MNLMLRSPVVSLNREAQSALRDFARQQAREAARTAMAMETPATRTKAATLPFLFTTPLSDAQQDTLRRHMAASVTKASRAQQENHGGGKLMKARAARLETFKKLAATGKLSKEIAKEMGIDPATACSYARQLGLNFSNANFESRQRRIAEAHRLRDEGLSPAEVAQRMGMSRDTVRDYLRMTVRP